MKNMKKKLEKIRLVCNIIAFIAFSICMHLMMVEGKEQIFLLMSVIALTANAVKFGAEIANEVSVTISLVLIVICGVNIGLSAVMLY